jgi:broad specificity phosphatase PhoE
MSLDLYIVRHGESYSNLVNKITEDRESELSIMGKVQAAAVGNQIKELKEKGIEFDAVYSSPYARAKNTCMTALKVANINKKVVITPYLVERDYYELLGQTITGNYELLQALSKDELPEVKDDKQREEMLKRFSLIESYEDEMKRFDCFLEEVKMQCPNGGNVLVFTHGLFEQAISKKFTGERPKLLRNGGIRKISVE